MPQWSTAKIGKDFSTSNYYSGNVTDFQIHSGCILEAEYCKHSTESVEKL